MARPGIGTKRERSGRRAQTAEHVGHEKSRGFCVRFESEGGYRVNGKLTWDAPQTTPKQGYNKKKKTPLKMCV